MTGRCPVGVSRPTSGRSRSGAACVRRAAAGAPPTANGCSVGHRARSSSSHQVYRNSIDAAPRRRRPSYRGRGPSQYELASEVYIIVSSSGCSIPWGSTTTVVSSSPPWARASPQRRLAAVVERGRTRAGRRAHRRRATTGGRRRPAGRSSGARCGRSSRTESVGGRGGFRTVSSAPIQPVDSDSSHGAPLRGRRSGHRASRPRSSRRGTSSPPARYLSPGCRRPPRAPSQLHRRAATEAEPRAGLRHNSSRARTRPTASRASTITSISSWPRSTRSVQMGPARGASPAACAAATAASAAGGRRPTPSQTTAATSAHDPTNKKNTSSLRSWPRPRSELSVDGAARSDPYPSSTYVHEARAVWGDDHRATASSLARPTHARTDVMSSSSPGPADPAFSSSQIHSAGPRQQRRELAVQ